MTPPTMSSGMKKRPAPTANIATLPRLSERLFPVRGAMTGYREVRGLRLESSSLSQVPSPIVATSRDRGIGRLSSYRCLSVQRHQKKKAIRSTLSLCFLVLLPSQAEALCRCTCVKRTMKSICQLTDLVELMCQDLCENISGPRSSGSRSLADGGWPARLGRSIQLAQVSFKRRLI